MSGKLAQLGSRLIDGVAKKMAAEFFQRFKARFASAGHAAGAAAATVAPAVQVGAMTGTDGVRAVAAGGPAPAPVRDIHRELRVWQAIAVTAIAAACLAIGYIIGAH